MEIHPIANHVSLPDMPSATNSDHDGRYYTETEIDTMLGDGTINHGLLSGLVGQGVGGGADDHGLGTKDSPQFTALNIGTTFDLYQAGGSNFIDAVGEALVLTGQKGSPTAETIVTLNADVFITGNADAVHAGGFNVGGLSLTDGSIDDVSGSINFGETNFTNVGTIAAGAITGTSFNATALNGYEINGNVVLWTPATENTFVGVGAGTGWSTGDFNVAIGFEALGSGDPSENMAVGRFSLFKSTGLNNMGFGNTALFENTSGVNNVGIGKDAGRSNNTGSYNISIGTGAGYGPSTQAYSHNIFIGDSVGGGITVGSSNVFIGSSAGGLVTSGGSDIFIGYKAGYRQTTLSNLFIVDRGLANGDPRASAAAEITDSILYGVMADAPANQTLRINASVFISGDGGTTNYSQFETDGTLVFNGAATVFNDLVLPLDSAKVPASNAPNWESFVGNLNAFAYQVNDFQEFTTEMIHGYKEGSNFAFHIHGALNALTAQEEKVRFEIEYSIADANQSTGFGDVFPDGSGSLLIAELVVPSATADLTNIFIIIGVDNAGTFGIDATIKGRIRRIAKSAGGNELTGDIFVTQVGVHYENDTVGSRTIDAK